jgi:hypothetical protein
VSRDQCVDTGEAARSPFLRAGRAVARTAPPAVVRTLIALLLLNFVSPLPAAEARPQADSAPQSHWTGVSSGLLPSRAAPVAPVVPVTAPSERAVLVSDTCRIPDQPTSLAGVRWTRSLPLTESTGDRTGGDSTGRDRRRYQPAESIPSRLRSLSAAARARALNRRLLDFQSDLHAAHTGSCAFTDATPPPNRVPAGH